jgi:chlorobactene glucosyltransferase
VQSILSIVEACYFPVLLVLACYFFFLSLANHYEMWLHTVPGELLDGPLVSVLIPARNEEQNIKKCLDSLCRQNYKNYEILVINDNSTDATWAIINRIARTNPRVRVFNGKPLPEDWYGKPFALHQLAREARGDILLFTDADTIHGPVSLSWAVTNITKTGADLLSGYVGQVLESFGERMTVPLMFFLTGFVIPLFMNRYTKLSFFSSAVGQYIAIKREVFNKIGGCEAFKKKTSEDIYMARHVKRQGYSTMFLDITGEVCCRMYSGYRAALEGIGKNIFDFLGKNTFLLLFAALAVFFFLLFPFPLFFYALISKSPHLLQLAIVNILYTLTWLMLFVGCRITWYYAFLWPLMFINLLYMAGWSWFRTISGRGFRWKDRVVT